jgi:hypothetical protein
LIAEFSFRSLRRDISLQCQVIFLDSQALRDSRFFGSPCVCVLSLGYPWSAADDVSGLTHGSSSWQLLTDIHEEDE